ncbi:hypothetical protein [Arthrobacter echini]|nr:hypothetical protein [Arthrobacter echini]
MKTRDDWRQEAEAFKAAALREHDLMRGWMARAIAAEARLKLYDAREAGK